LCVGEMLFFVQIHLMQKRLQDPALSFQHTCHDTQCFSSTDFSKNTYQKVAVKVQNHLNFGKQMSQVQGKRKKKIAW